MSRTDQSAEARGLWDCVHEWQEREGETDVTMLAVAIEAGVRELVDRQHAGPWDDHLDSIQDEYRDDVRAVLSAVLGSRPYAAGVSRPEPVVTDEMVEAGARAAYDDAFMAHAPEYVDRWDDLVADGGGAVESWRRVSRACLVAALGDRATT